MKSGFRIKNRVFVETLFAVCRQNYTAYPGYMNPVFFILKPVVIRGIFMRNTGTGGNNLERRIR